MRVPLSYDFTPVLSAPIFRHPAISDAEPRQRFWSEARRASASGASGPPRSPSLPSPTATAASSALICGGRSCCYTGENSFPLTGDGDGGRMAGTGAGAGERAGRRRTDRGSGTRKMAAQGRTDCPESSSAMQCIALQLIYRQ